MQHRKVSVGVLHRTAQIREIDSEQRTVDLSFSSEEPVDRFFGQEILDHSDGSVRLGRLNGSGPLLMDHDPSQQIGVVESASVSDRKGRATVRFSQSDRAQEIFQDVIDGIRKSVSVGYRIYRLIREEAEGQEETMRVTDWEPLEVSLVSVPADTTVGVGREAEQANDVEIINPKREQEEATMPPENQTPETTRQTPPAPDESQIREAADKARSEAQKAERERVQQINVLGSKFEQGDLARQFVENGQSVDEFRQAVLDKMGDAAPIRPANEDPDIGMSGREVERYSFVRLLNALANPNDRKAQEAAQFEFEASQAAADHYRKQPQGAIVPSDVMRRSLQGQRDLTVGTASAGGDLVSTDLLAQSFIELLRNRMVLSTLGVTTLMDLIGDLAIPRQTGGATAYWVAESGAPTESTQAFDQVTMSPKTVGAFTDYSRKLLKQSSIDIESFVRGDLARVLALEIDRAGVEGSGLSNQPEGVKNVTGINSVPFTTAGSPTWAEIVDLESKVAADNADIGTLAYLIEPTMRGTLKTTERASGTAQYVWEPGNTVNGYRTEVSNQVTTNDVYFGNWADLLVGMWGGLDLMADPYTNSTSGAVRIVALQDVDAAVRHPESFCLGS